MSQGESNISQGPMHYIKTKIHINKCSNVLGNLTLIVTLHYNRWQIFIGKTNLAIIIVKKGGIHKRFLSCKTIQTDM